MDLKSRYIDPNTVLHHLLNPYMDITTTHKVMLLRIMLCGIALFLGEIHYISLFLDSLLCVSNMSRISVSNVSI